MKMSPNTQGVGEPVAETERHARDEILMRLGRAGVVLLDGKLVLPGFNESHDRNVTKGTAIPGRTSAVA